ncbi:MAG: hypothetical protein M1483_06170 [Actinobacteria bacterium]|nr:hypothetical protein [Actinomycetota bacterium]MCL6105193.1 hypothetical protein [Actinomycetota bacterium]
MNTFINKTVDATAGVVWPVSSGLNQMTNENTSNLVIADNNDTAWIGFFNKSETVNMIADVVGRYQ